MRKQERRRRGERERERERERDRERARARERERERERDRERRNKTIDTCMTFIHSVQVMYRNSWEELVRPNQRIPLHFIINK